MSLTGTAKINTSSFYLQSDYPWLSRMDLKLSSYTNRSDLLKTRPSLAVSGVDIVSSLWEIRGMNVYILDSSLMELTLKCMGDLNHVSMSNKQNTSSVVIHIINSTLHQFLGIGVHLEMSECLVNVTTSSPLVPMFVMEKTSANITNCVFKADASRLQENGNSTEEGLCFPPINFDANDMTSRLFVFQYSNVVITKCSFEGIYMFSQMLEIPHLLFASCIHATRSQINMLMTNVTANSGLAVIHLFKSNMTISNSDISLNTPINSVITATGTSNVLLDSVTLNANDVCNVGIILVSKNSSLILKNTVLLKNMATYGGGIYVYNSSVVVNDSAFTNNIARSKGGVIFANKSVIVLDQSIFKHNIIYDIENGKRVRGYLEPTYIQLGHTIGNYTAVIVEPNDHDEGGAVFVANSQLRVQTSTLRFICIWREFHY